MSSEIDGLASFEEHAFWALENGLWDGRPISWQEVPEFVCEVEERLQNLLFAGDLDDAVFQRMTRYFAWIGSEDREALLQDIGNPVLAVKHRGQKKSFWEKHKVAIIIGIAVVVVVTAVVVVTVCTSGAGGQAAAGIGASALSGLKTSLEGTGRESENNFVGQSNSEWIDESLDVVAWRELQLKEEQAALAFPDHLPLPEQPVDRYATEAYKGCYTSEYESQPPYQEVELLGYSDQSTIHFHCGINNDFSSVTEGGACLSENLGQEYAIQPHWIHEKNIVKGLALVSLEKIDQHKNLIQGALVHAAKPVLQHSDIQKSIDYEAENLSKVAQDIIEINNPRLKQVHVTFSNGGYIFREALKQLPPEHQDTIVVITAGTTSIIEKELAHEVYNIIGDKDWPSRLCNGGTWGIETAKNDANIDIIEQNETQFPLGGHYFVQPEYQERISKIIDKEISEKYEIY